MWLWRGLPYSHSPSPCLNDLMLFLFNAASLWSDPLIFLAQLPPVLLLLHELRGFFSSPSFAHVDPGPGAGAIFLQSRAPSSLPLPPIALAAWLLAVLRRAQGSSPRSWQFPHWVISLFPSQYSPGPLPLATASSCRTSGTISHSEKAAEIPLLLEVFGVS